MQKDDDVSGQKMEFLEGQVDRLKLHIEERNAIIKALGGKRCTHKRWVRADRSSGYYIHIDDWSTCDNIASQVKDPWEHSELGEFLSDRASFVEKDISPEEALKICEERKDLHEDPEATQLLKRPPDKVINDAEWEDFLWAGCKDCGENVCVNMYGMGKCRRCGASLPFPGGNDRPKYESHK